MANWCSNRVRISGKTESMNKLKEKICSIIENDEFFMEGLIGWDDNFTKDQWYEHNCKRYGTKWDFKVSEDDKEFYNKIVICPYFISFDVDTAWTPIYKFVVHLCKQYDVRISLSYCSDESDYMGTITCGDGVVISNDIEGIDWFLYKETFEEESNEISKAIKSENVNDLPDVITISKDLLPD